MRYISFINNLLNKKEKRKFFYIGFLLFLNSFFELLGLGLLLPVITIILDGNLGFLPEPIFQLVSNIERDNLIIFSLLGIICVYIFKNLFIIFYHYQQGLYIKDLKIRIFSNLFEKYIFQNYSFFLQRNTGTILRNLGISRTVALCLISYLSIVLEFLIIISFLSYLLYLNFFSTIIISLIFLIFGSLLYLITKKKIYTWASQREEYDAKITQQLIQTFSSIKNIKIFNKEVKMNNFLKKLLLFYEDVNFKIDIVQQLPRGLIEILGIISISILIIILNFSGMSNSEILVLTAIFAAAAFRLIPSSTRVMAAAQRIKNFAPALELIQDELNNFVSNQKFIEEKIIKIDFKSIKFEDVSFSYDQNNEIFTNINFQVNKGDVIGVLGESGVGKSTLINLASGLIEPTKGEIKINDKSMKEQKKSWLASLGYVPQQVTLFNDSIKNNISFFDDGNYEKKLNDALFNSKLQQFVDTLPNKVNTVVGEGGAKLSGGEIQRIGIARALFNNPEFIIFDESTSSLDENNEKKIIEFIYSLKRKKTVMIISHKREILRNCDKIYEVKNKKILQTK